MSQETIRQIIFIVVCTVLVVRTPVMATSRERRPLWILLLALAGGSIVIQSWFGTAINRLTGVAQFNNLVQGVWGVLDVAVTLHFAIRLSRGSHATRRAHLAEVAGAAVTVAGMCALFAVTPASARFAQPAGGWSAFTGYALLAATYMIVAAAFGSWLIIRQLAGVTSRTLYTGLLMIGAGNATEVPFMAIRTLQRITGYAPPPLLHIALLLDTARFILLPLGSVIAAIEPLRQAVICCCRRARIYPLWRCLRDATEELELAPSPGRWRDLFVVDDSWGRLHQRMVEIRDSILWLYDTWVSPGLLDLAAEQAAGEPPELRALTETACWLEAARRLARSGAKRGYHLLDREPLTEALPHHRGTADEVRQLLRLHRAMHSPGIRQAVTAALVREQ